MSEQLAKKFHDTYERLSIEYGWKTQEQCQVNFADLPKENRELMIAVVSEVCSDLLKDSERLDKLLKQECRHYYGTHPDDFEMIESREAIDKLEESL